MPVPCIVVDQHQHARGQEYRVGEFDPGEAPQVLVVEDVRGDAEGGEGEGQFVDYGEEELGRDYGVYHAAEGFAREDGVLFDELGEVVEARGDGEGEEEEAEEEAGVALEKLISNIWLQ